MENARALLCGWCGELIAYESPAMILFIFGFVHEACFPEADTAEVTEGPPCEDEE